MSRKKRMALTNEQGRARFDNLPDGEYRISVSTEGYLPYKTRVLVDSQMPNAEVKIGLIAIDKSSLNQENERLRATVLAATDLRKIQSCVSQSHNLIQLTPMKLKGLALKQYRKTAKAAHKRIDELRTSADEFVVGATVSQAGGLGGSLKRESRKRPLV